MDTDGDKKVRNDAETLAAREKAEKILREYEEWLWKDPDRAERLSRIYNDTFNTTRPRSFDGAHLELPGMTKEWHDKIHAHRRTLCGASSRAKPDGDNSSLLAHEVGFWQDCRNGCGWHGKAPHGAG